jgi:hypothetical protein
LCRRASADIQAVPEYLGFASLNEILEEPRTAAMMKSGGGHEGQPNANKTKPGKGGGVP